MNPLASLYNLGFHVLGLLLCAVAVRLVYIVVRHNKDRWAGYRRLKQADVGWDNLFLSHPFLGYIWVGGIAPALFYLGIGLLLSGRSQ